MNELQAPSPLEQSNVFCMLPWTSIHVNTDGTVLPCCLAEGDAPLGSVRSQWFDALWNSPVMRELRRNMIADLPSHSCAKCYERERSGFFSLRQLANEHLRHHAPLVAATESDGTAARVNLVYLDVRFSNVCNFRCRICSPCLSTAWYHDAGPEWKSAQVIRPMTHVEDLLAQVESLLGTVEMINFTGGEPLLSSEHYHVLERLVDLGRTDVQLYYTTNLSALTFGKFRVLSLWSKFRNVHINASLDASGARGEYLRKGQDWARTVENRRAIASECPHIDFQVTSTVYALNALHLPDFHEEWIDLGLIQPNQTWINILHEPDYFRLTTLNGRFKQLVRERYERYMSEFLSKCPAADMATRDYLSTIRFMESMDTSHLLSRLASAVREMDQRRGECVGQIFPELSGLF